MADEPQDGMPQGERDAAHPRGRLRRFFASKEGQLIGLGVLAIVIFFLVRYFGGQGQNAVNAAGASLPDVGGIPGDGSGSGGTGPVPAGPPQSGFMNFAPDVTPGTTSIPTSAANWLGSGLARDAGGPVINQATARTIYPVVTPASGSGLARDIGGPAINQATARNYYHATPVHPPHALAGSIAATQHSQAQEAHFAAAQRLRAGHGLIA